MPPKSTSRKAAPSAAAAAAVGGTEAKAERRTGQRPVPPKTSRRTDLEIGATEGEGGPLCRRKRRHLSQRERGGETKAAPRAAAAAAVGGTEAKAERRLCHRRHEGAPIWRSVPPKAKAALSVAASGDISPAGGREGKGAKAAPRAAATAALGGTEATAERRTGETPVPPKT